MSTLKVSTVNLNSSENTKISIATNDMNIVLTANNSDRVIVRHDGTIDIYGTINASAVLVNNSPLSGGGGGGASYDQANTARDHANSAFAQANNARTHANTAHLTANAAFDKANTANQTADLAYTHANNAFARANTANITADLAYAKANVANQTADLAFGQANTARTHANNAHLTANAGFNQANTARTHANAAFDKANSALANTSGVGFNGDLNIFGNLNVSGNLIFDTTSSTRIWEPSPNALVFFTSQSEAARITNTGNVLIARTNESVVGQGVKLDVAGAINATAFLINGVALSAGGTTDIFARDTANAAFNKANTANLTADLAFGKANTANQTADLAFGQANTARTHANTAHLTANAGFDQANTARTHANNAYNVANLAYAQANTGGGGGGATIVSDTVSATRYVVFVDATSGTMSRANVDTNLTYNPSSEILSAVTFNATSDETIKYNIETIQNSLETINKLRGVSFDWKKTGNHSYGVVAQEVEKVLPELVDETTDTHIKSVNYNALIGFFIEAIKELNNKIEDLENRLNAK